MFMGTMPIKIDHSSYLVYLLQLVAINKEEKKKLVLHDYASGCRISQLC